KCVPSRQPVLPRFTLNCALISGFALRSLPAIEFASAAEYQVPATGAFGKSRKIPTAPAEPSVAELDVQLSAAQLARIVIVTLLLRVAPHRFAANWKALSRCWPKVVPELFPTGETGVVSLKPTPG